MKELNQMCIRLINENQIVPIFKKKRRNKIFE